MKKLNSLLSLLKGFRRLVLLAIFLGWATVISWIALISTSSFLLSYAALQPSIAVLQVAIVGVRFFGLSRGIFRYLERLVSHSVTLKLLSKLRVWYYDQLESISWLDYQKLQKGDLLSTILADVENLQDFYVRVLGPSLVSFLTSLSVIFFVSHWSLKLGAIVLIFHLIVGVVLPLMIRQISKTSSRDLVITKARLTSQVVDIVHGQPEILAFGQSTHFFRKISQNLDIESRSEVKLNRILAFNTGLSVTVMGLISLPLIYISIPLVINGFLDGKLLAVVILGGLASFEAIITLPGAYSNLDAILLAGERLFGIEGNSSIPAVKKSWDLPVISPWIRLENIEFSHSQSFSLNAINLDLPFGKKMAIVGESGSGKTTIANLLMGLYEISGGSLILNGENLKDIDSEILRHLISYVPQNGHIFNATIEENIRIGNPKASMGEVRLAAQRAMIDDFIFSLPSGYQTEAGQLGGALSGGERQRLVISRAILRDSPIFILDEPYENLDRTIQMQVSKNLKKVTENKTMLLITHDLIQMKEMDEILVVSNGKIIERGTEVELIQKNGEYKKMYTLQQNYLRNGDD